MLVHFGTISRT